MQPFDAFTNQLAAVPGIAGFVLVGPSGEVLAHSGLDAESLSALAALCEQQCRLLGQEIATTGFQHLAIHRVSHEKFFLVPMTNCTLGFLQRASAVSAEVLGRVKTLKDAHAFLFQ